MLYEELARFSELSGEDGKYTSITRIGGYLDGYDKGREDERRDWKLAAGELIMKYAGDIYDALPEAVKEIYEQGRKDGIAETNLKHNIECGDCVRQITAADEARIRADERGKMLMPYDVESVEELVANVRSKTIDEVVSWILSRFTYTDELNIERVHCNADTLRINLKMQLKGEQNEND